VTNREDRNDLHYLRGKRAADGAEKRAHRLLQGYEDPFRDGVRSPKVHPSAPRTLPVTPGPIVHRDPKPVNAPRRVSYDPAAAVRNSELGNSGARRMLTVLCQSRGGVTASQLALRSGISRRGGTFRTYLGKLLTSGWAERNGDRLTSTAEGARVLGPVQPLPTGRDLLAWWVGELGQSGAARMLEALAKAYPKALSKEQLGERTGIAVEGGTFRTYLGKLKTLELVEGGREIRMSEELADR
jgi:hypothetical protein